MILKVCGMKFQQNLDKVGRLGPDWIGIIFYPKSPRYVDHILNFNHVAAKRIGVFVDADPDFIQAKIEKYKLDGLQFHGHESPDLCRRYLEEGFLVIKTFHVSPDMDFSSTEPYEGCCTHFLFDTKGLYLGGNGELFDWSQLEEYKGNTPFVLSGGIRPSSVKDIQSFEHPSWAGIDINSRFEVRPGLKNVATIKKFKHAIYS